MSSLLFPRVAGFPRRHSLLLGFCALVLSAAGLVLSTVASYTQVCMFTCGPWQFEPWWGFWASLGAFGVCVGAVIVSARRGARRGLLALVALAAVVSVTPVPVELWRENELRRVLEGLI